ncbi:MAG: lipoyl protein ligase domain-containing protein [Parachlamydiaceae bacterium]
MHINFLSLNEVSILNQLKIEEALLRTGKENWCLVNAGSPPAIVMGVSAKPDLVVNSLVYQQNPVPVIRRFSGGGTVFIDEQTLFVTFILNGTSYPEKVLEWTHQFYRPIFSSFPFSVRENDYTIGEKKFGGNAQYFRKDRFLHHTSFLFDYRESNMHYLLFPPKTPEYRQGRSHQDFLIRLSHYFETKQSLIDKIKSQLEVHYRVFPRTLVSLEEDLKVPHRQATSLVKII